MIRVAEPADAGAIADVHVRSWQAAYRGQLPDDVLDNLSILERTQMWSTFLTDEAGNLAVVERDSQVVGFVSVTESRDVDAEGDTGEITSIYLLADSWGRGFGGDLMGWAKSIAESRKWRLLTLWVLESNGRARSFYSATGWKPDGRKKTATVGSTERVELRYAWRVEVATS